MSIQNLYPAIKPSLNLDFANTKKLDPRITFTRASTATYYDGVTSAKAEENLFTYSQDFANAAWTKAGTTITANSTTAPDSTTTASTVTAAGGGIVNRLAQTSIGGTFTFSFYAKANTQNLIQLNQNSSSNFFANFDLSTGTLGTVGVSTTATITSVGSGWYRCTMTVASATSGVLSLFVIDSSTAAAFATTTSTNNFYVWGAQLEQRSAVTAYTPTTTQPITNYIPVLLTAASGVPRFDHNPTTDESLGLLIEEQRTNLLLRSEEFASGTWIMSNGTKAADVLVAPNGAITACKITTDGTGNQHTIQQIFNTTTGVTYTSSMYVKSTEGNNVYLRYNLGGFTTPCLTSFDLSTGTVVLQNNSTGTITPVGNGWFRVTMTATATSTATGVYFQPTLIAANGSHSVPSGTGIYIWGAQLEAGAFPTSYIATVASQVTRAADAASMTGTNFSSWYNQGEGTVYAELNNINYISGQRWLSINDATNSNRILVAYALNTTNIGFLTQANGVVGLNTNALGSPVPKLAFGVSSNNFAYSQNGALSATGSSGSMPSVTRLQFGNVESQPGTCTIKKIAYYPLRVTNAQLQALTS